MIIPGVCNTCRKPFVAHSLNAPPNVRIHVISEEKLECPLCGGDGRVVAGTYQNIDELVLGVSEFSPSDLIAFREALLVARNDRVRGEEFAARFQVNPIELGEKAIDWLLALIAILLAYRGLKRPHKRPPPRVDVGAKVNVIAKRTALPLDAGPLLPHATPSKATANKERRRLKRRKRRRR